MSIDQQRGSAPANLATHFSSATMAPYGLFLLRVAIGIDWIAHAFLKTYRGMNTHEALLARNGITPMLAWPTFSMRSYWSLPADAATSSTDAWTGMRLRRTSSR